MSNERGASLIEYAFLLVCIALVCFGGVQCLGQASHIKLSTAGTTIGRTQP